MNKANVQVFFYLATFILMKLTQREHDVIKEKMRLAITD